MATLSKLTFPSSALPSWKTSLAKVHASFAQDAQKASDEEGR